MACTDLENLLRKYENAETKEDLFIKRALGTIAEQLEVCESDEYYYADIITRYFCRILEVVEKQHEGKIAVQPSYSANREISMRFQNDYELASAFYNYYKRADQVEYAEINQMLACGRGDLVNPTMKDYVARIYTFTKKYMGELFSWQEIGNRDPVLFAYDNIERILATFKTRDERGEIVKQRVNIRSALRKLNEFKQRTEQ